MFLLRQSTDAFPNSHRYATSYERTQTGMGTGTTEYRCVQFFFRFFSFLNLHFCYDRVPTPSQTVTDVSTVMNEHK
jgi:hypothetical protein